MTCVLERRGPYPADPAPAPFPPAAEAFAVLALLLLLLELLVVLLAFGRCPGGVGSGAASLI